MSASPATIRINVDVTNPGQFFACCGLLELASRSCGTATGQFLFQTGGTQFVINLPDPQSITKLWLDLSHCSVTSSLTEGELDRLRTLLNVKKTSMTDEVMQEKEWLSAKWGNERLYIGRPFDITLDWWQDESTGGSKLKTWAGKQFVTDIVSGVLSPLQKAQWHPTQRNRLLEISQNDGSLPFYFDATIGAHSASGDVGFSLDALSIRSSIHPAVEFLAFVGLQRFRPQNESNGFRFSPWTTPLPPILAAPYSASGYCRPSLRFTFNLLYRTKYLKAFLPAKPIPNHHE